MYAEFVYNYMPDVRLMPRTSISQLLQPKNSTRASCTDEHVQPIQSFRQTNYPSCNAAALIKHKPSNGRQVERINSTTAVKRNKTDT